MSRFFVRAPRALVLFGVFATTASAHASPAYPETARAHLDLSCTPKCQTCHESDVGRSGNARQPFALSLIEQGLVGGDEQLLKDALDAVAKAGTDSDKDEVPDIEELLTAPPRDPSVSGVGDVCAPEIRYGCGAQMAPAPEAGGYLLVLGALGLRVLSRRGRRS